MFLASVHHSDYMAHDVSTFRNQDSELPLGIFPPGFFSAFDRFNRRHRTHWADVLIAFCTRYCCSMLIVNISSHCLHRNVISSGMFRWFASSKEPALFPKDMSTATWVLLRVVHPSFALSGLYLALKTIHHRFVYRPTRCSPLRQSLYRCHPTWPWRAGRCGLVVRKCARVGWRHFFGIATNPVLSTDFMMDTSLLVLTQLELVMINVMWASELAPSMTFERPVCHQDIVVSWCVWLRRTSTQFCCSLDTTCTRGLSLCSL